MTDELKAANGVQKMIIDHGAPDILAVQPTGVNFWPFRWENFTPTCCRDSLFHFYREARKRERADNKTVVFVSSATAALTTGPLDEERACGH
jgi:hypothetical protein